MDGCSAPGVTLRGIRTALATLRSHCAGDLTGITRLCDGVGACQTPGDDEIIDASQAARPCPRLVLRQAWTDALATLTHPSVGTPHPGEVGADSPGSQPAHDRCGGWWCGTPRTHRTGPARRRRPVAVLRQQRPAPGGDPHLQAAGSGDGHGLGQVGDRRVDPVDYGDCAPLACSPISSASDRPRRAAISSGSPLLVSTSPPASTTSTTLIPAVHDPLRDRPTSTGVRWPRSPNVQARLPRDSRRRAGAGAGRTMGWAIPGEDATVVAQL